MFNQTMTIFVTFAAVAALLSIPTTAAVDRNGIQLVERTGIQSGPDSASSYAGGMVYANGVIYLTGATYGNSFFNRVDPNISKFYSPELEARGGDVPSKLPFLCFAATLSWPSTSSSPIWKQRRRFGSRSNQSRACTSLALTRSSTSYSSLIQTFNATTGIYSSTPIPPELHLAGYQSRYYNQSSEVNIQGIIYESEGDVFPAGDFTYPKAMVAVTNGTRKRLFITSMVAYNSGVDSNNTEMITAANTGDTLDPTKTFVGDISGKTSYRVDLQDFIWTTDNNTYTSIGWINLVTEEIGVQDGESVDVSSLLYFPNYLVNIGYEMEYGLLLQAGSTNSPLWFSNDDELTRSNCSKSDGYISKTAVGDSNFLQQVGDTFSTRIRSQSDKNDYINGLCQQESEDAPNGSNDRTVVYAVGTTEGIMVGTKEGGAFLVQLNLTTLHEIWRQQIPGVNVEGLACAVTRDGQDVYLAGNFVHGTELEAADDVSSSRRRRTQTSESAAASKNTDIFVAQFSSVNGTLNWIQTIGTSDADESLAQGNSGGLAVDELGNALVYGNTRGSLFRNNTQGTNDVFVAMLSRDYQMVGDDGGGKTSTTTSFGTRSFDVRFAQFVVAFVAGVVLLVAS